MAKPGRPGLSHFAKYFELEQYEDTLKRAAYEDSPLLPARRMFTPAMSSCAISNCSSGHGRHPAEQGAG